jgi:hypothetical protein
MNPARCSRLRPRKRMMFKLLVLIIAGAIINAGVAWAFAAFYFVNPDALSLTVPESSQALKRFADFTPYGGGISGGERRTYQGVERTDAFFVSNNGFGASADVVAASKVESGWPIRALLGAQGRINHMGGFRDTSYERIVMTSCLQCEHQSLTDLRFGQVPLAPIERRLLLPYGPIWPGFAINTFFYAAILWMLFTVPGALRRRIRIKRGQCAACGYSLRENVSERCPECGAGDDEERRV